MSHSPFFLLLLVLFLGCKEHNSKTIEKVKKNAIALKFQSKGDYNYNQKKFDSAFYYYNRAKNIFENDYTINHVTYCSIQMASIQQVYDDFFGSETTLIEILPYLNRDNSYRSAVNNLLGIAAKEMKNYDQALDYYSKTYQLADDSITKVVALNNIANVNIQTGNYTRAVAILESFINEKFLDAFPLRKAIYIDNLGYAYFKKNEIKKGEKLMRQSLNLKLKNHDSYGAIESYLHLAELYLKKYPKRASFYGKKAYINATIYKSINERLESLLFLIKSTKKQDYALQYAILNDSITNVRNSAKNQFAKIKYDAKVTEEENLKLKNSQIQTELELQKSENEKDFWLVLVVLLVSFVLFLFNYFKNKNRQEKQKATYFTETRIAKKIHDELANDVFQTISYIETKSIDEPQHREELINLLDNIYQRSRNISKENESIETGEYFNDALIAMINSYKTNQCNVIIKKDETINWQNLLAIKKITIFRVLQELLINMKKHSQATIVLVSFASGKNDINIDYSDNGKGLDLEKIKKSGLSNVENRIKNINGKITFDSLGKGLKTKINIPK
ncbi:tetratricopeptide repeat protein [Flavobacterium oreochromis]|uniref:tetratricopeptide repeat-containing sensor histidine kinase n=1 Tax=Flavobacterium oreochromis TaxID=2906078 RepID=UPI00385CC297